MLVKDIKTLLLKANSLVTEVLYGAAGLSVTLGNYEVCIEHLLIKLCETPKSDFALLTEKLNIDKAKLIKALNMSIEGFDKGNSAKPSFSPLLLDLFESAWTISSIDLSQNKIRSGAIFAAFILKKSFALGGSYRDFFEKVQFEEFLSAFNAINALSQEYDIKNPTSNTESTSANSSDEQQFISKYCNDFTAKAKAGKIDPVFGRDEEIRQIVDVLSRRRKNNPICVGEPGVGKTAVVEGLARRITEGDVPDVLKNVRLIELDIGLLEAGASIKGEFEKRLKGVIDEVKASEIPIIMFIDEAHTLIGAGGNQGGSDAANLLKPALARGELRTIAATTWSEYKKYFEKDPALTRRFQPIKLDEPSVETATLILSGIKSYYEKSHNVTILSSSIKAAAELSDRYINGRFLPDKAIDLLDTACARVKISISSKPAILEDKERKSQALECEIASIKRDIEQKVEVDLDELQQKEDALKQILDETQELTAKWKTEKAIVEDIIKLETQTPINEEELNAKIKEHESLKLQNDSFIDYKVNPEVIAKVVSDWTGIPLGRMLKDQTETVLNLENYLVEKVKGQDHAMHDIAEVIRASKSGVKDPSQPIGVFLLAGPSGVGKTETALSLAQVLFGSTKNMVTINMSEFQEAHTVSKLVGSPPGYVGYGEGGILTEAVRQKPYSIVLLDEVEKAHLDVVNIFYQVFDKGVLTDGEGKEIDFKNTVIILTTNLGSATISKFLTQHSEIDPAILKEAIASELKAHFKPALYARMNVIPYMPLDENRLANIAKLKIAKIANQLQDTKKITLTYTDDVLNAIVKKCDDPETGARNIDFVLNKNVLPRLSKEILIAMSEDKQISKAEIYCDQDGIFNINLS